MNTLISSCHCCGLVQRLPALTPRQRALCARCETPLKHATGLRNRWARVLALSALMLYPPAMALPLLRLDQLGHHHEDSLWAGLVTLLSEGYWLVGAVVLLFSVILPPLKLLALYVLCGRLEGLSHKARARMYRAVEALGRWGMLDVMLVAVLVAFVKLGDLITIRPGPGLVAFLLMVMLSLFAGLIFNPHGLWEDDR